MFFLFSRFDPDFHQGHINSIIIQSIVFIEMASTDKSNNLTCEIISHVRLFMIISKSCENYGFSIIAFQRLSFI